MMEKQQEKQKGLHIVFIDLEKAYNRVPRQEVWRCMRVKGTPEKHVRLVQDMYEGAKTQAQERRLQWYGHVMRRDEPYVGMRVMQMEVPGGTTRGRPKRRWMDVVREDLRDKQLSEDDVFDRAGWRKTVKNIEPT
ncbi:uncharacterized protein [Macrobrachium rosenbergii]|uniref:uncharacterized protein n=1 Tax=Macrobrachium rosenbergii TaxID=79674 RepID=UPI0034D79203